MTQEEKNIKICEALGWKKVYQGPELDNRYIFEGLYKTIKDMPNHFADLNAMHEAEKVLKVEQHFTFQVELARVINTITYPLNFALLHATATQRAEAFGLTLNLWKQEN